MPSALLRSGPSWNVVVNNESAVGAMMAAEIPCTTRDPMSTGPDHASPHVNDEAANRPAPIMNMRRRPSRSAKRPPSSRKPPKLSR
jgi:hypothetical protein